MLERILIVDDEPNLLSGLQRHLRQSFSLTFANSGSEGLTKITEASSPFAVIVSDYRMPGMDGIQFLSQSRKIAPDTVRVLFTGHADLKSAVDAVNEGNIFRLLMKPTAADQVAATLRACIHQYELIVSQKALLEQTLRGAVSVLSDILAAVCPQAFSCATRIRGISCILASKLGYQNLWEVEIAAMLSQIGCVTIPARVLERKFSGQPLFEPEEKLFRTHPNVGAKLIQSIPRLENVAESIAHQAAPFSSLAQTGIINNTPPVIARILKAVLDFDSLVSTGKLPKAALDSLKKDAWKYDPQVLACLEEEVLAGKGSTIEIDLAVKDVAPGMMLAEDVLDKNGLLLIAKGHQLSEVLIYRLQAFMQTRTIGETVRVLIPNPDIESKENKFPIIPVAPET